MASPLSFLAGGINGGEGLTASPFSADTHFTFTLKALIRGKPSLASWVELLCWLYGASGGEEERVLLRAENAKKARAFAHRPEGQGPGPNFVRRASKGRRTLISVIEDRAQPALARMALEPEKKARLNPTPMDSDTWTELPG